jgi:hypothetical protein
VQYDARGGVIYTTSDATQDTMAHEILHVMLRCAGTGAADDAANHGDAVWKHVAYTGW